MPLQYQLLELLAGTYPGIPGGGGEQHINRFSSPRSEGLNRHPPSSYKC